MLNSFNYVIKLYNIYNYKHPRMQYIYTGAHKKQQIVSAMKPHLTILN